MKKRILSILICLPMIISATSCGKKEIEVEEETTGTNVEVYTATLDTLEDTVSYTGEIKAISNTSITTKVSAKITKVHAKEGDYVTAGTVLAELDDTDIRSSYNSALANYNSALASYNAVTNSSVKQSSTNAKNSLESAQLAYNQAVQNYNREKELYDNDTRVIAAKNAYDDAKAALERTQQLFEIGAASQLELDAAKTAEANAKAGYESTSSQNSASMDSAYNTLKNAENSLRVAKEAISLTEISNKSSIETANAGLQSAKTALENAKNNLSETVIKANSTGYIATENATVGQMAAAGTPLFTMKDVSSVVAEIEVTESVIPYIKEGTQAVVDIPSASQENISGVVTLVNPTKNEQTGMFTVQITIDNKDGKIHTGMFADVDLVTQTSESGVSIPTEAIFQEEEDFFVYVADPTGNTASKVQVMKGIETNEKTEILSGISAGDLVITSGQDYLSEENNEIRIVEKDGDKVEK